MSRLSTPAEPLAVEATKNSDLDPATEERLKRDLKVMRSMTTCSQCNQVLTSSTAISCLHSLCASCFSLSLLQTESMKDVEDEVQETSGKRPRPFGKTSPPSKRPKTDDGKVALIGSCPVCSFEFSSLQNEVHEYTVPEVLIKQMKDTEKVLSGELSNGTLPSIPVACFSQAMCYPCADEGNDVVAVTRCDLCGDLFCQEHGESHEKRLKSWRHTCSPCVNEISPSSSHPSSSRFAKCLIHQEDLDTFCDDCLRFTCSSCKPNHHSTHRFIPVSLHLISTLKARFLQCSKKLENLRNLVTGATPEDIRKQVRRKHQREIDVEKKRMEGIIALLSAFIPAHSKAKIMEIVSGVFMNKATEVMEERLATLNDLTDRTQEDLDNIERMGEFSSFFVNSLLLEGFQQLFPVFWLRVVWTLRCESIRNRIWEMRVLQQKARRDLNVRQMISDALAAAEDPDPNLALSLRSLPALLKTISI